MVRHSSFAYRTLLLAAPLLIAACSGAAPGEEPTESVARSTEALSAFPGLASFVTTDGQHLLYVNSADQHVHQLWYDAAANVWVNQDMSALAGAPAAASASALSGFGSTDGQHVFYLAQNQHVEQLYLATSASTWITQDLTSATAGPLAAPGEGIASFSDSQGEHVYYISPAQRIQQLWFNPSTKLWINQDLTSLSSGAPLAIPVSGLSAFSSTDGQHVSYVGAAGHIEQLFYQSATNRWFAQDLTSATNGPAVPSWTSVSSFVDSSGQHIYYLSATQHVEQLFFSASTNTWINQDLTTATGGLFASGSDGLASFGASDGDHVYYVDSKNHVDQLWFDAAANKWFDQDLTILTSALVAAPGTDVSAVNATDGQHVYFTAQNGEIEQLFFSLATQKWIAQGLGGSVEGVSPTP